MKMPFKFSLDQREAMLDQLKRRRPPVTDEQAVRLIEHAEACITWTFSQKAQTGGGSDDSLAGMRKLLKAMATDGERFSMTLKALRRSPGTIDMLREYGGGEKSAHKLREALDVLARSVEAAYCEAWLARTRMKALGRSSTVSYTPYLIKQLADGWRNHLKRIPTHSKNTAFHEFARACLSACRMSPREGEQLAKAIKEALQNQSPVIPRISSKSA